MKINLHELEHIKIALYRLKKDSTLSDKYKYEIDNLYKQVSKFLVRQAFAEAMDLHKQNRFEEAKALYNKILTVDDSEPNALHLISLIFMAEGDFESAKMHIEKAINKNHQIAIIRNDKKIIDNNTQIGAAGILPNITISTGYSGSINNSNINLNDFLEFGENTSNIDANKAILRFTDDAKLGTYLSSTKFDVEWNEEKRNWFMLGEITDYTSGNSEDKGKYTSYSEPISFYLKDKI